MAPRAGSYPEQVDIVLALAVVAVAVAAWTAWEASMVSRLAHDTRSLPRRNAAVAGAHRLTVVGQLGLVAVAVVLAGLVSVPVWGHDTAVASPVVGAVLTGLLVLGAAAATWWSARRGHRPQDRRALLAVAATAFATEVLLRGFGLGALDASGWPVTAAVLVTSVATGLLQASRAPAGSRAFGFVLATLLGFVLGLVVLLTGSVLAAAAVHVTVSVLGLGRTFPARDHAPGCLCGRDHGAASTRLRLAHRGRPPPARPPGPRPPGPRRRPRRARPPRRPVRPTRPVTSSTVPADAHGADGHVHAADGSHAACGTSCTHAGSSACAVCPLSTARV